MSEGKPAEAAAERIQLIAAIEQRTGCESVAESYHRVQWCGANSSAWIELRGQST